MPYKKGSCLNEEYTEKVEQIHKLLKEAKEIYESLPSCIKHTKSRHEQNTDKSLGWYLINGETSAWCFAEEFGIEVDR